MNVYWLCANGTRPEHLVNLRSTPEISNNIIGKLYTTGLKARKYDEVFKEDEGKTWSKYYLLNQKIDVWVRDDVYSNFLFGESKILEVKNISQEDENSSFTNNECAVTSGLMAMTYGGYKLTKTVDDYVRELGIAKGALTNFNHIILLMKKYTFKPVYKRPGLLTDVFNLIKNNIPVICLINYGQLVKEKEIPHFLLACGYDQEFIYCQNSLISTDYINYTHASFAKALANIGNTGNNMPYQIMYADYTKEQMEYKTGDIYKRIEKLEGQVAELIIEMQKLRGG